MASRSIEWNETLTKMARPDIYRINAFRILKLPVTASIKEVKSQIRKHELMQKYSNITQQSNNTIPPRSITHDNDIKSVAQDRLKNPELRFIDEFFWFWPISLDSNPVNDEALTAIRKDNLADALSIWKKREVDGSECNVSRHNLAVYYHSVALDMEKSETGFHSLTSEQKTQKRAYWREALTRWGLLQKDRSFWNRVQQRVDDLDDPRINYETIEGIRDGLPKMLLIINSILAVEASEMDDLEDTQFHIKMMQESGFSDDAMQEAIQRALITTREKLKTICINAREETEKLPGGGYNKANCLIKDTNRLLLNFDRVLLKGDATRESAHDEVALQIRSCLNSYAGTTKNWPSVLEMAKKALEIAESISTKKKIEEDINAISNILKYATCWFCGHTLSNTSSSIAIMMHGDVQRERGFLQTKVRWKNIKVTVPRCNKCENAHETRTRLGCGGAILGLIIAIFLGIALDNFVAGLAIFAAVSIAGYLISLITFPAGIKPEPAKNNFPTVQEMLQKGWNIGEKPGGVS